MVTNMKKQIEDIKEFQIAFGCNVLQQPEVPEKSIVDLRHTLIMEEVNELAVASENGDIVECADAITDILYVLLGTACEYGLIHKVEEMWGLVHANNMGKADPITGKVIRRSDGKIQKPEGFKKVELSTLFNK